MTNLDSILKSRDITLPTKVCLVKVMVFLVVMYGCESWTVKKAEHRKIDAFELWCWRRLLRVPWTARRSNPRRSVLGVHWKDWCWSWNSNTWATSCKELTHWKRPWCEEGLGAGGEGDDRGWGCWMASLTRWTWVWVNSGSWWWTGRPGMLRFMGSQRVGHDWATDLNCIYSLIYQFSHSAVSNHTWTAAHQASLSITKSQSLLKLMSNTSDMCQIMSNSCRTNHQIQPSHPLSSLSLPISNLS